MIARTNILRLGLSLLAIACLFACNKTEPKKQASKKKRIYRKGEMSLQHGMQLFNQHCASCHSFTESSIGPNLAGVTSEVEKEWLVAFIQNAPEVIESGDERAVKLFEKYKQYMPPFPMIEGEDLEDILAFIHKFSQGEKRNKKNRPGGLINPIPEIIPAAELTLVLEEQFIVPASSEVTPLTRINKMDSNPQGRVFLHDLRGKLYEVKDGNQLDVYFDIATLMPNFVDNPGKGTGFGAWAFHPNFAENGLLYTTHNEAPASAPADFALPDSIPTKIQGVLTEWKTATPDAPTFTGTPRELLRIDLFGTAHGLQELVFNPLAKPGTADYGMLYLGIGDASLALAGYPFLCNSNQHVWGSVIRIDPAGNYSANGNYGIPPDNPFVNDPDAVGEIWNLGHRNPHRITWDETGSGLMLITNIGQHSVEEVNLGKAGAHYGWPDREGTFAFDVEANVELVYPLETEKDAYTYPVIQYDHDEGSAASGGFVYSGSAVPELKGKYVFGDISLGTLFYTNVEDIVDGQQAPMYRLNVSINGKLTDMATISQNRRVDLRIGRDQDGELYLMTKGNGGVYKVVGCMKKAI